MIDQLSKALPDKAADYDGHMKWNKAATSLKDLFDISVDANTAPQQRPEVKAAFTKLKRTWSPVPKMFSDVLLASISLKVSPAEIERCKRSPHPRNTSHMSLVLICFS